MSIIDMKRIAVIGLDTVKEDLISDLMEIGVVEITDTGNSISENESADDALIKDGAEERVSTLDLHISRVSQALEVIERYSDVKSPLFFTRRVLKKGEFAEIIQNRAEISRDVNTVMKLQDRLNSFRDVINKRNTELAALAPWSEYDVPMETRQTAYTVIEPGTLPSAADIDLLIQKIYEKTKAVEVKEISRDSDMIYIVVITVKSCREDVLEILRRNGYTQAGFDGFKGTVAENTERIMAEISEHEKKITETEREIAAFYSKKSGIECLHDELVIERDHEKIKGRLLKTRRTFSFEGWVPANCMETVEKALEEKECCFVSRDPEEGETVPVLMHNSSMAYPFEAITEMYSLPDYRGVDPTKYFALFYAMFFGIMLSDAGYGIVMAAACFIILKKFSLEGMTYKMIKMFFLCGLSTVFWGALFGGWFGDFFQVAAKVIFNKEITIEPIWFNPIEDPTRMLIWSLVFGVIHLFLGMGIHAAMLIKRGRWKDAVFDVFSWYMVILGGVMWLAGGSISAALVKPGMYITLAGASILLLTGGRNKKGLGKITGGLSSLYSITSYVSDILSYSRLLALGLATGVIASVVNTMGSLAGGGIWGTIVLLIVFVAGHSFNMAINALGAFVHSSRLQYIEFFGKFYEDGGEEFEPLKKNTKYVRLMNDTDGGRK